MNFVLLKQGVEKLESAWHMKCTEKFETFIILIAEIIAITACDLSWRLQANVGRDLSNDSGTPLNGYP